MMESVVNMLVSSANNSTADAAGATGAVYGNPIFQGGFLLLIAGVVMNMVSGYFSLAVNFLFEQLMTHIDVNKEEDAYDWVLDWLASQPKNMFTTQRLSLSVHQKKSSSHQWKKQMNLELVTKERPKIKYLPGSGMHILFFNGTIVWLYRSIKDVPATPSPYANLAGGSQTRETLSIVTIGRSKSTIDKLIQTAMSFSLDKDVGNTVIYNVDSAYGSGWSRATAKECRSMDSVILDVDMSEELIEDATEFLSCGDWYRQLGIPYRRTYLFHGKPGCGKTSFVAALAAKLKLNVCFLSLSAQNMNDAMVNQLLLEAPVNAMILLEDVDVAFPSREEKEETNKDPWGFRSNNKITFSGLINAIDGIASQEGRIFIMTTNYKKRLDPALLRPGRVDRSIHFPLASVSQIRRMFLRFYPKEEDLALKFAERIGANKVSMAQLQGYFLAYKNKPLEAFNHCEQILQQIAEEEEARKKKKMKKKKEKEEKEKAKVGDLSSLVKIIEAVKEKDEGGEKETNGDKKKGEAGQEKATNGDKKKGEEKAKEKEEVEEKGSEEKQNN